MRVTAAAAALLMLALLALVAAAALLYAPAMRAGLAYEDVRWWGELGAPGWPERPPTRWLTMLTLDLQRDSSLASLHWTNFLLHGLCASLAALVALGWWGPGPALVSAAALLLSPGATQAVGYLSARGEIVVAALCLAAVARPGPAVLVACGASLLLAKESAALAGAALLAVAAARAPFPLAGALLALLGSAGAVALYLGAPGLFEFGLADPVDAYLALSRHLLVFLNLASPTIDFDPTNLGALHGAWAGALLVGAAYAFACAPRARLLVALVALSWLPRLLVDTGDAPQEHHAYLAGAALSLGAGWLWHCTNLLEMREVWGRCEKFSSR